MIYIPFVRDSQDFVNASLILKTTATDTSFTFLHDNQYNEYGFDTLKTGVWSARNVFHILTNLDRSIFGRTTYKILDNRIFGGDTALQPVATISGATLTPSGKTSQILPVTECIAVRFCADYRAFRVASTQADDIICNSPTYSQYCTTYWVDNGLPSGTGGTGGGAVGSGGTGGGTGWTGNPCQPSGGGVQPRISINEPCTGGGTGWVSTNITNNTTIFSAGGGGDHGKIPIANFSLFINCLTKNNYKSISGYKLIVFIEQPSPGSRTPYTGNPITGVDPGHSFIMIERQYTDGTNTQLILGYYPENGVKPGNPTDQGKLYDNSEHDYNTRLEVQITPNAFQQVLDYVTLKGNATYNLNTFNCTTFTIEAAQKVGINFPSTKQCWTSNSCGVNPADLDQDIREGKFTNNSTSAATSYSYSSDVEAPVGDGPCF
jgi:hypothetical protein